MEGNWGHEQGVNNTFYGSPDGEIALLITALLFQCDPEWPNTFINSLFRLLCFPPIMASCVLSKLAGGDVGIYIIAPSGHHGLLSVSPQRFLYKRNLVLKGMWDPMPLASDTFLGRNSSQLSLSQMMNVLVSIQEVVSSNEMSSFASASEMRYLDNKIYYGKPT